MTAFLYTLLQFKYQLTVRVYFIFRKRASKEIGADRLDEREDGQSEKEHEERPRTNFPDLPTAHYEDSHNVPPSTPSKKTQIA